MLKISWRNLPILALFSFWDNIDTRSTKFLNLEDFKKEMEGVYSTSVSKETLDESPMAYRDVKLIKDCLTGSVDIIEQLKPIINVKGY